MNGALIDDSADPDLLPDWVALTRASGLAPHLDIYENLARAYREPHRCYHTLSHIQQMLWVLRDAGVDDIAALWATWFHDYVYRPGRRDNEARSAAVATTTLSNMNLAPAIVDRVAQMVRATQTHTQPSESSDPALALFLDADMSILGTPADQYDAYRRAVRQEHRTIPGFLYRRGRRAFLKGLLEQGPVFLTTWFGTCFEAQAQRNVLTELGPVYTN